MNLAILRFHSTLGDFFPSQLRGSSLEVRFKENPSIKHLFESLGVPHVEVNRVIVNQVEATFAYQVRDGDQIDLYPVQIGIGDSKPTGIFMPEVPPEGAVKFVLDNHLGKLNGYLRLLGFDSLYSNDFQDAELAQISANESRTLLTRDRRLLMRSIVSFGYWVRETDPQKQIVEVLARFQLYRFIQPFRRCIRCNGLLHAVEKERILDQLEPLTRRYYQEFHQCEQCGRVYWQGSHYARAQQLIQGFLNTNGSSSEI